jgi:hypothetical protein
MKKEPPDKYRTLKISLKQIIKSDEIRSKLFEVTTRTNKLVIHVYQILRLWILNKYHNNEDIPNITPELVKMIFKAISKDSIAGKKPAGDNFKIYTEFKDLYEKEYKQLGYETKLSSLHLSQIINYQSIDMVTNINNNISLHFIDYVKKYVNQSFKDINTKELEKFKGKLKTERQKELNKELYLVKQDLFENTLESNEKYHKWIKENRHKLLPKDYNKSYHYDVVCTPQKYLKHMIFMNLQLEKLDKKLFQICPLRTNIYPKYCPFDTKSLIEILIESNKNEYYLNLDKYKDVIWSNYFNLGHKIFKQKKYKFDYRILSDGYAVSIQFINNKYVESEKIKKQNMKEGRNITREATKGMTNNEKEKYKKNKEDEKKKQQEQIKKENQEKKDKQKKVKKLKKTEKQELDTENKLDKYIEFPYLDEISEERLNKVKESNKVYNDPGKRVLLNMIDDKGNKLRYTNRQRITETKRLKYQSLIKNHKDRHEISIIENELTDYNSKTCKLDKYKEFIKKKNNINDQLYEKYEENIFRKYKWYGYLNTLKSEARLLENIKKTFGEDCTILYGDWGVTKQMRNFISTPMIGIKRKVKEKFSVYNLDEFRTSCLNYKTEEKCENIYLPDKKNKSRKIHAVLTFQMENNRKGCINRDWNSVKNMKKIVDYWFINKERPLKYRRDYDLQTKQLKVSNPSNCKIISVK